MYQLLSVLCSIFSYWRKHVVWPKLNTWLRTSWHWKGRKPSGYSMAEYIYLVLCLLLFVQNSNQVQSKFYCWVHMLKILWRNFVWMHKEMNSNIRLTFSNDYCLVKVYFSWNSLHAWHFPKLPKSHIRNMPSNITIELYCNVIYSKKRNS